MARRTATERAGRPGRKLSLNGEHTAVLRAIVRERPRCSLDELTRELFVSTGANVNPVIGRKPLRQARMERLKSLRRAGESAPAQGFRPSAMAIPRPTDARTAPPA